MRPRGLVAAIVAVLCTGCSGAGNAAEPADNGPVTLGSGKGDLCMPMPATGVDAALGFDVVRNNGSEAVTITGVSAVDPRSLRVTEVFIVPVDDELFGVWTAWPPRSVKQPAKAAQWKTRRPAVGYQVPPHGGPHHNLVAHIVKDPSTSEATMGALRVEYTAGGRNYWAETTNRLTLKPACTTQSDAPDIQPARS